MTQTTEFLRCLHDLLMHMYTHVFAFIHSIRMNGWLPSSGQEGGPLALFYEIQEATLHGLYSQNMPQLTSGNDDAVLE